MEVWLVLGIVFGLVLMRIDSTSLGKSTKAVSASVQLQCPPCSQIHCAPKRAERLKCKGGYTRGVCNCCPACAKVEGEKCGGDLDYLGKCDKGLYCEPSPYQGYQSNRSAKPEGRCRRVPNHVRDEAVPAYCQPQCTPEFCRSNPRAICSALEVVEKKQDCQGDCQHTSCSACSFVKDEPDCVKCRKDDFKCIKKFARCIRQQVCTRHKFPCKKRPIDEKGKFRCLVPECL